MEAARARAMQFLSATTTDGSLGCIIAWYSIIHTPSELLPEVFAEFHRR